MFPPSGTPRADWPWRSSTQEEQALNEYISEFTEADHAINEQAYDQACQKGSMFIDWLYNRDRVPQEYRTTQHTTFDELERWGWSRDESWEDPAPELPGWLHHHVDQQTGKQVLWENNRDMEVEGVEYHATYAHFKNSYWPDWGIISADDNASPKHVLPGLLEDIESDWYGRNDWQHTQLKRWSDVTFLTWKQLCNNDIEKMQGLNLILRSRVMNRDARRVISAAMKKAGQADGMAPALPGQRFTIADEQFDALMGIPNLVGVVFMLLQHETELGRKVVSGLTIFNANPDLGDIMSILVELSWSNELPVRRM